MTLKLPQPITGLLDDDQLPASSAGLITKWRDLDEKVMNAELEIATLETELARAKHADDLALRDAIEAGDDLPDGDEHAKQVTDKLATARRQHAALEAVQREVGTRLRKDLRAHREEIADLARPRLTNAIEDYTKVIKTAKAALRAAGAELGAATAPMLFLKSLDEDQAGIGPDTLPVTTPDLTEARANLDRVRAWQPILGAHTPDALFAVRDPKTGRVLMRRAEVAYAEVGYPGGPGAKLLDPRTELHELANPADLPKLQAAVGHPVTHDADTNTPTPDRTVKRK